MEKKTNVAKENHNRENQHFSETWYKDGGRIPPKVNPIRVVGNMQQEARDEISRLLRREKIIAHTKFWILSIGTVTAFLYFFPKLLMAILPGGPSLIDLIP